MTIQPLSPLEIGFKVWENSHGWCWLVVGPHNNGGTIGAAATEADAIRDVRSLVDDLSAQHRRSFAICLCGAHHEHH